MDLGVQLISDLSPFLPNFWTLFKFELSALTNKVRFIYETTPTGRRVTQCGSQFVCLYKLYRLCPPLLRAQIKINTFYFLRMVINLYLCLYRPLKQLFEFLII